MDNDTDVLVMLVYHLKPHMAEIFLQSEVPSRRINRCTNVSIAQICHTLGEATVSKLLLVHGFSGCDTTSALYGHSKCVFRIFKQHDLSQHVQVFETPHAEPTEVANCGYQLFSLIYSSKLEKSLYYLRYTMHMASLAVSTHQPSPHRLRRPQAASKRASRWQEHVKACKSSESNQPEIDSNSVAGNKLSRTAATRNKEPATNSSSSACRSC